MQTEAAQCILRIVVRNTNHKKSDCCYLFSLYLRNQAVQCTLLSTTTSTNSTNTFITAQKTVGIQSMTKVLKENYNIYTDVVIIKVVSE